ncbi:MAG: hypothetical protein HY696_04170 [Deltaproteobacteria bacterium]|nr:hypothetical protein [Deltaproteobacteria bacterium]
MATSGTLGISIGGATDGASITTDGLDCEVAGVATGVSPWQDASHRPQQMSQQYTPGYRRSMTSNMSKMNATTTERSTS